MEYHYQIVSEAYGDRKCKHLQCSESGWALGLLGLEVDMAFVYLGSEVLPQSGGQASTQCPAPHLWTTHSEFHVRHGSALNLH